MRPLCKRAEQLAARRREPLSTAHLLMAISAPGSSAAGVLEAHRITPQRLERLVHSTVGDEADAIVKVVDEALSIAARTPARAAGALHRRPRRRPRRRPLPSLPARPPPGVRPAAGAAAPARDDDPVKLFPFGHATHPQWRMAAGLVLAQLRAQMALREYASNPTLGLLYITDHYAANAQDILDHLG
ncbi:MAG TPA: Clp protease N-terminal domain-containing protein, partial [Polyangiaceae bacterium]|nr:Clp protease N-terminal domain-containing protein [Polyangiaceae bacterium]